MIEVELARCVVRKSAHQRRRIVRAHVPPFGIAALAGYLRAHGVSTHITDASVLDDGNRSIIKAVLDTGPAIVGFSSVTPLFPTTVEVAKQVRAVAPDTLVIIGGAHASLVPQDIMKNNACFDLLVRGEGEDTLLEIAKRYHDRGYRRQDFLADALLLSSIKGIVFRSGGRVVQNTQRPLIKDLDSLPYVARDLLQIERYRPLPNRYRRLPMTHMVVSRGCPFKCTFCSNRKVMGSSIRIRSPESAVKEIQVLQRQYGIKEICFWDDTFTAKRAWVDSFCDLLLRDGNGLSWSCFTRVDRVCPDMLIKMREAGCWSIYYGVESGSQVLLDLINKGIKLDQARRAFRWTKSAGIEAHASFILGLPGESPRLGRKTIQFAFELDPDYAYFTVATPYPGTEFYEQARREGKISEDLTTATEYDPHYVPSAYQSARHLARMHKKAILNFYLRPSYLLRMARKIRSLSDLGRYVEGFVVFLGFLWRSVRPSKRRVGQHDQGASGE